MRLKPALATLAVWSAIGLGATSCTQRSPAPAVGIGNSPCVSFLVMNNEERNSLKQWVTGYLSAYNAFYSGPRKHMFFTYDADNAADAILYYCQTHNSRSLAEATGEWLISLRALTDEDLKTKLLQPKAG